MSKEPKMTPWFPSGTEPARDGVYEVVFVMTLGFAHYRAGKNWSRLCGSPEEAATAQPAASGKPRWRGLAEKPIPSQGTNT